MSINKTAYFITIGETDIDKPDIDIDGIMADEFEETLIFVGRLIERLHNNVNFKVNTFMLFNIYYQAMVNI